MELTGDLATATPADTFKSHYLVIPERSYDASGKLIPHPRIVQPGYSEPEAPGGSSSSAPLHKLSYAMLLDKSFFDLSGQTCNKIGVGPTAFKYQSDDKCGQRVGACLKNQLEDFHKEDVGRIGTSWVSSHEFFWGGRFVSMHFFVDSS